jgi:hypothetical protein
LITPIQKILRESMKTIEENICFQLKSMGTSMIHGGTIHKP